MADTYIETLREPIEAIKRALTQPEVWPQLRPEDKDSAERVLNACAVTARELRRLRAQAEAAKADAEKEVNLARAREQEFTEQLKALEENLVKPLCEEWGEGKTHQINTGYARVALVRKRASVVVSGRFKSLPEAEVVSMLPHEYVRMKPPEANRDAIKAALKAGVVVPGFELQTDGVRIDWRS